MLGAMAVTSRGERVLAACAWLAGTAALAGHLAAPSSMRPLHVVFAWVAAQTVPWLIVGIALLEVAHRSPPVRRLVHLAALAPLAVVLPPLLQRVLMGALRDAGLEPAFGPVFPWPAVGDVAMAKLPSSLVAFSALAAGAHLAADRRQAAEAVTRAARLEAAARGAELEAWHARMHPHFLFNALHTVDALIDEDPRAARRVLHGLSGLLRRALTTSGSDRAPLGEELGWVDAYVAVQKARFEERLVVEVAVADDVRGTAIPVLLLQPLVENAVKHGVAASPGGAHIHIGARRLGDSLRIEVLTALGGDRGADPPATGLGLGLELTRARLAHLYEGAASVEVEAGPRSHRVVVRLPVASAA
jgi:two-component system LytT family sensor kinase